MRARGLPAPLSREGGPSYREAKGGDVQPVPLVLLRVYAQVRLPRGRVPHRRNHSLLSRLPPSTSGCRLHPVRNLRSSRDDAAPPHRAKTRFSPVLRHAGRILEFGPQKSKGKYRDATRNDSGMGAAATSQSPPAGLITRGRTIATMPPRSSPCAPPTTASRA